MLWLYIKLVILRLREPFLQCIFNFLCAKVKMSEPWPSLPNMGPLAPGKPTGPIVRSNRICLIKWIPNSTFRVPITNFRSWRTSTSCTDTCLNKLDKSLCKNVSSGNKSVCNLLIFRFSMRKDTRSLIKLKIYMNFICIKSEKVRKHSKIINVLIFTLNICFEPQQINSLQGVWLKSTIEIFKKFKLIHKMDNNLDSF